MNRQNDDNELGTTFTGAQLSEDILMDQTTDSQKAQEFDRLMREMAEADTRRAMDVARFLNSVFGGVASPLAPFSGDEQRKVRVSER